MTVPLWLIVVATFMLACGAASRLKPQGDFDFVTPLVGAAIIAGTLLFWSAFFLGRWLA